MTMRQETSVPGQAIRLDGRVAVVLGGTDGIGRALSLGLADAGADVVASGRRVELVESVASDIKAKGRRSLRIPSDVKDRSSLERLNLEVTSALGKVDILINCAGKTHRKPTLDVTEDQWNDVMDTNLTGTLRACQVFGRAMLERHYGRIINIASLTSFVSFFEVAAYAASKAATAALTKSLAVEWGAQGVCVNAIAPGVFRTALNQALLDEIVDGGFLASGVNQ
jgi:NAD(P)-dependent dehydrogenase (short-subunit alcohol dehydrogenase family)